MSKKATIILITAKLTGTVATIRIVDIIDTYGNASSSSVRQQVDDLLAKGATSVELYLSSRGGDPFESTDIENELDRFGTENVEIQVGALAASAASKLLTKFKSKAFPNSQIMIHRPRIYTSGDVKKLESDLKLLTITTDDYKNSYAKKTGKTPEEIEALWADGDYWMTAQEAHELGLIDEITEDTQTLALTDSDVAMLEACGAPIIPSIESQNKNPQKMDKLKLIAMLGLAADATDEMIEAAIQAAKGNSDTLDASLKDAQTLAAFKAKNLVNQAVKDKKILATQAAEYEALAVKDYDSVSKILSAAQTVPQLSAGLPHHPAGNQSSIPAIRADWTLDDYLEKDPAALEAIEAHHPDVFASLNNSYFSKK